MKKILAAALFAAMMFSFAACGNDAGSQSEAAPSEAGSVAGTSETVSAPAETEGDSDWAYIESKGEMIIGITYFEPMNYLTETGELAGFETEFAEAVAGILGVTPVFQEISWSAKEIELNAKNIDMIWNGMTIDAERAANMSISQPYMENKQVLVVKAENAEAAAESAEGLSIVAEAGSAGETVATGEAFFEGATFIPVDTQAKALLEVAAGTADGCLVDYVASIGMIGEGTDFEGLVVVDGLSFEEEEYGIAMRKADEEFTQKVNDAINELIANGTLDEIAAKYKLEDLLIK